MHPWPYQSLIAVILAIFLFHKGPLIFFLCKGSPSVIRQVPVTGSLSRHKIGSSLPHFLLSGHVLKEMGIPQIFLVIPCLYMTVSCWLLIARKNYKLNPLKIKDYGN